jgi:hypothetical protein
MKTKTRMWILGLGAFLVLFSFLASRPASLLGTGGGAKPVKWKAVISDQSANLIGTGDRYIGDGWVYDDRESGVDVYAVIGSPYRMIFRLFLSRPNQFAFIDIYQKELLTDGTLKFSKYPPDGSRNMFAFLGDFHPWDDNYLRAQISFFGPWVSSKAEADWENMLIGESRPVRMWMSLEARNLTGDCSECSPDDYHSLEGNTLDAYIVRESPDTWTAVVDTHFVHFPTNPTTFDYPNVIYDNNDFFREFYCECIPTKVKNRIVYSKETRNSARGAAEGLAFKIKFIKTS